LSSNWSAVGGALSGVQDPSIGAKPDVTSFFNNSTTPPHHPRPAPSHRHHLCSKKKAHVSAVHSSALEACISSPPAHQVTHSQSPHISFARRVGQGASSRINTKPSYLHCCHALSLSDTYHVWSCHTPRPCVSTRLAPTDGRCDASIASSSFCFPRPPTTNDL
jgi:hypothetical protein